MKISTNIYNRLEQIIERCKRISSDIYYCPDPNLCDIYIWDGDMTDIELLLRFARDGKIIITKYNSLFKGSPFIYFVKDNDIKDSLQSIFNLIPEERKNISVMTKVWIRGMNPENKSIEIDLVKKKRMKIDTKFKLAICTGAWKRFNLLELFCKHYDELKKYYPIELYISVSENEAKQIIEKYNHIPVEIENTPLSNKMNAAVISASMKKPDYCLMVGSDDFLSHELIEYYFQLFENGFDYIYTLDWYFFDTKTKRGLYWGGYIKEHNRGHACGAGRCLSNNLLQKMKWTPWLYGYDNILDTGMDIQLRKLKYKKYGFYLRENNLFAIDIKSSTNMTPFNRWDNTVELDGHTMLFNGIENYEEIYNLCAE